MRTCSGCQSEIPDDAETCPRCGNLVPRGFFASISNLFRGKPAPAPATPPAPKAAQSAVAVRAGDVAGAFSLRVEDVFTISGRGTVVTGLIASGEIKIGDQVRFTSPKGKAMQCAVVGVEMFRKIVNEAKAGDTVGLLLRGVKLDDLEVGTNIESA